MLVFVCIEVEFEPTVELSVVTVLVNPDTVVLVVVMSFSIAPIVVFRPSAFKSSSRISSIKPDM